MSNGQKPQGGQAVEVFTPQSIDVAKAQAAQRSASAETTALVLGAREKALVEARYVVAMKQPRDIDAVRAAMLRECARPSFASVARYHKPIGKGVEGPSIRFAEAAIQAMGNVAVDTPMISEDAEKRIFSVTVSDIERNASYSQQVVVTKTVERSSTKPDDVVLRQRTNKWGKPVYVIEASDDDILNKQNALISKAIRTLGLRLVPGWLVDECMIAVRKTQADENAANPDAARHKLFDGFAAQGVPVEEVKKWLGHDGAALSRAEYDALKGIWVALRDGETTWREVMDAKAAQEEERKAQQEAGEKPKDPKAKPGSLKEAIGAGSASSAAASSPTAPGSSPSPSTPAEAPPKPK